MVVRMRHTRSHTANRRSHHALKASTLSLCKNCGLPKMPHTICKNCGQYKGRKVVDVLGKISSKKDKKTKKAKAK